MVVTALVSSLYSVIMWWVHDVGVAHVIYARCDECMVLWVHHPVHSPHFARTTPCNYFIWQVAQRTTITTLHVPTCVHHIATLFTHYGLRVHASRRAPISSGSNHTMQLGQQIGTTMCTHHKQHRNVHRAATTLVHSPHQWLQGVMDARPWLWWRHVVIGASPMGAACGVCTVR